MGWLLLLLLIPLGLMMDMMANSDVLERIAELIRCVFRGKLPEDDEALALSPAMRAESLCQPLPEQTLMRVRACVGIRQMDVQVECAHWLRLYLGVADLVVRYDFEGSDAAGETVSVHETAFLRVRYSSVRSRFGLRSVTLKSAEPWEPGERERKRWLGA